MVVIALEGQGYLRRTLTPEFPGSQGSPVFAQGRPGMAISGGWDSTVMSLLLLAS